MSEEHIRRQIAQRLSLRAPQERALDILAEAVGRIGVGKGVDLAAALAAVRAACPQVESFERDFPSLCFALATGVGKTRLMGAFIAFLHPQRGGARVAGQARDLAPIRIACPRGTIAG